MRRSVARLFGGELWTSCTLALLLAACTYQPLTDAEKAGLGAAGAEPILDEDDATSSTSSSAGGAATSSTAGGSGGTDTSSSTESTTGTGATGGGTSGTNGTNGTGGTGGTTSGGSGGGTASTTGSGGTGGTASTTGSGGTGGTSSGTGGVTSSGGAASSASGGATGSGGTSQASTFRYVRLAALSSQNGNPFTAIAELELLDSSGQPLDNSAWTASADSEETVNETAPASQAIDGDTDTFWHTEWGSFDAPLPHYLQIDLGSEQEITGFVYTPRQDGLQNGWILAWEFYLSNSATDPGTAVDSGSFGSGSSPKTVNLP